MSNVEVTKNQEVKALDSREVAEMMEVSHKYLLRKIDGINEDFGNSSIHLSKYWIENTYKVDRQTRNYRNFLITMQGIKIIIDRTNKTPKLQNLIKYYNERTYDNGEVILADRFETTFFNKLIDSLEPLNINIELQKPMFNNKYRIDGYIEDLKLAIEYDEGQHFIAPQKSKDIIRQQEIENELGCTFVRLNYENSDAYNIGVVMKNIFI